MTDLYIINHLDSNTFYIGIANDPDSRWKGHLYHTRRGTKRKLYDFIRENGEDRFRMTVIAKFDNRKEAAQAEKESIDLCRKLELNLLNSWGGYEMTDETIKKLSEAHKGQIISQETREKIRLGLIGRSRPQEVRDKIAKTKLGRKQTPLSTVHKEKISKGLQKAYQEGRR